MGSKAIGHITTYSLRFSSLGAYDGQDRCPKIEYAVHEGDGAVVLRIMWVVFVWYIYMSLVALVHHFWGVYLLLAIIVKTEKVASWDFSGRILRTSLDRVSGQGTFPVDARRQAIV